MFYSRFKYIRKYFFRLNEKIFFRGNDEYSWGRRGLWLRVEYVQLVFILTIPNDTRKSIFFYPRMKWFILKTLIIPECCKDAYMMHDLSGIDKVLVR